MRLKNKRLIAIFVLVALAALVTSCLPGSFRSPGLLAVAPTLTPLRGELVAGEVGFVVTLAFAPDGRLFYGEQSGAVFVRDPSTALRAGLAAGATRKLVQLDVAQGAESGLLGLAVAPDFDQSRHFYLYYNVPDAGGDPIMGRIVRYTEVAGVATAETTIVDNLPARPDQLYHFGGALSFGPDGKLYLIFGDTNRPAEARDPQLPAGSILRYNPDGTIPADNPFPGSPVYAYGIRNGFGLAWHPETGLLYETENGESCDDELNLIVPGGDYGWGVHAYNECPYPDDSGTPPLYQWNPVVAPAGMTFYTGDRLSEFEGELLLCGFNNQQLFHVSLSHDGRRVENIAAVKVPGMDNVCRVNVVQGPDGWLYTTTDSAIYRIGR